MIYGPESRRLQIRCAAAWQLPMDKVVSSAWLADGLVDVLTLPPADWQRRSDAAHATAARCTWDDAARKLEQSLLAAIEHNRKGR